MRPLADLLDGPPRVVNVGVEDCVAPLRTSGVEVVSLDWHRVTGRPGSYSAS